MFKLIEYVQEQMSDSVHFFTISIQEVALPGIEMKLLAQEGN